MSITKEEFKEIIDKAVEEAWEDGWKEGNKRGMGDVTSNAMGDGYAYVVECNNHPYHEAIEKFYK